MDTGIIVTLISIALTILGIIVASITIWNNRPRKRVKWRKILKYVKKIADELRTDNWIPDVLVSFPKGGLIVADLLGHQFNNELDIVSIHTQRIRQEGSTEVAIRAPYVAMRALNGKRILIIDDVISGGQTMKKVKQLLRESVPVAKIQTAVLGTNKSAIFSPDHSAFTYNPNKDLYLPWGKLTL